LKALKARPPWSKCDLYYISDSDEQRSSEHPGWLHGDAVQQV